MKPQDHVKVSKGKPYEMETLPDRHAPTQITGGDMYNRRRNDYHKNSKAPDFESIFGTIVMPKPR
jgi:hypothetical protein